MVTMGMVRAGKAMRTRLEIMWGLLLPDFYSCFLMFWEMRQLVTCFQAHGRCLVPRGGGCRVGLCHVHHSLCFGLDTEEKEGLNKQQVMFSPTETLQTMDPQRLCIMINDCRLTEALAALAL